MQNIKNEQCILSNGKMGGGGPIGNIMNWNCRCFTEGKSGSTGSQGNQVITSIKVRVRIMARVLIKEEEFEEAREKLALIGVILYRKKHKKGGYVCRASKKLKEMLENERES